MIKLYHGDCLDLILALGPRSVNLVLADLPYGTTSCEWDRPVNLAQLWLKYKYVLAPGGCIILFGAMPFTARLVVSNLDWYRDHLIADKNKCGSPALAKIRPMRVHEDIIVFARPGERYTYNPQMEVGEPYSRKSSRPEGYVGRKNDHGYGMKPRKEFTNTGTRYPKSIIDFRRDFSAQQQINAAQKPVPGLRWLIRTYSNPGDTVLDNTMGSGSTGVAAKLEGRKFIGIELDLDAFNVASARINEASL